MNQEQMIPVSRGALCLTVYVANEQDMKRNP